MASSPSVSACGTWELAGGEFLYELAFGKFAGFRKS